MANTSTLEQSLINAKRVMNKVEDTGFTKGDSRLSSTQNTISSPNINMESVQSHIPQAQQSLSNSTPNLNPKANLTEERINKSNLPDAIKNAMINNPIPDIPFNGGGAGLSEEFLSGVKNQMDKQGIPTSPTTISQPSQQQNIIPPLKNTVTKKLTSSNLKSLIKESVKELLDETIGLKKNSNENFQFRVGDRIFYGKITSSKSVK